MCEDFLKLFKIFIVISTIWTIIIFWLICYNIYQNNEIAFILSTPVEYNEDIKKEILDLNK